VQVHPEPVQISSSTVVAMLPPFMVSSTPFHRYPPSMRIFA
jgi:hypothetical protein